MIEMPGKRIEGLKGVPTVHMFPVSPIGPFTLPIGRTLPEGAGLHTCGVILYRPSDGSIQLRQFARNVEALGGPFAQRVGKTESCRSLAHENICCGDRSATQAPRDHYQRDVDAIRHFELSPIDPLENLARFTSVLPGEAEEYVAPRKVAGPPAWNWS